MNEEHFSSAFDFELLHLSVVNNIDYFYYIRNKYWYGEKFLIVLRELVSQIHWYEENLKLLHKEAHCYDFSDSKGNGFRSFCLIFDRYFLECYNFCKRLSSARESMFFRPQSYLKEVESLVNILIGLRPGLNLIKKIILDNEDKSLLMPEKSFTAEELIIECGDISQLGFYGQYQGFYYCTSMRRILQGVGVIVATFSDLYQSSGGPISKAALTILNVLKYIFNSELRAKQIVDVAQNSSIEFLKAFWSLSGIQFMKALPGWICPRVQVRKEIFIPPVPILLKALNSNEDVVIPVPASHTPIAPVRCLLLSSTHRNGQVLKNNNKCSDFKSKSILFHCHGGGFISQNPESHEIYLRHWAHDLNIPIISIDYSLSPQAPFPRALEEVLLAYAWVLNNPEKLGWTGETICFAGDSAGGNILMGLVLKAISLNIRLPDLVLCAYTPLILDIVPSPSRLLCWIDPLLPLGFMISCLDAYCGALETDRDEYVEDLGKKSRKISSISDIFDSSIKFIKQCSMVDVDANDLSDCETNSAFFSSESCSNSYVNDFSKLMTESDEIDSNEPYFFSKDFTVYDFTKDIAFDLKEKWKGTLNLGINKVSDFIMSSPLYINKKVLAPFLPNFSIPFEKKKEYKCPPKSFILDKIKKLKIVSNNPFMSPLLAPDDLLKKMPPIQFVSLNFDPCLDDSIAFAKKLEALNCHVKIDVLDGLPHGFLNFLPFSKEAHDGSNLCVRRLKEAMKLS